MSLLLENCLGSRIVYPLYRSRDVICKRTLTLSFVVSVHDEQEGEGQEAIGGHRAQAVEGSHPPKRKLIVEQQCKLKIQFIKLIQWGS